MKFLKASVLVLLVVLGCYCGNGSTLTWLVLPEHGGDCHHFQLCDTLDFIVSHITEHSVKNLTIVFSAGNHYFSKYLKVQYMERLCMKPASKGSVVNIICSSSNVSIHLSHIIELTIADINIMHCGQVIGKVRASLYVSNVKKFTMSGVAISHGKGYGLYAEDTEESDLVKVNMDSNHGSLQYLGGNAHFVYNIGMAAHLSVIRTNFTNGKGGGNVSGSNSYYYAGGISISNYGSNLTVQLYSCLIENNTRRNAFIGVEISKNPSQTLAYILNTNITSGKGVKGVGLTYLVFSDSNLTDTTYSCATMNTTNALTLSNTKFVGNEAERSASGLLLDFYDTRCTHNVINITHCKFVGNHINSSSIKHSTGTALLLVRHILADLPQNSPSAATTSYAIAFSHTCFVKNYDKSRKGTVLEIINSKGTELSNCRFISNLGTALSLHSSSVLFSEAITFDRNNGTFGAAIHLCETSFFYLKRFTNVTFSNNYASQKGGAIYDQKACMDKHAYCFYQPLVSKPTDINTFHNESKTRLNFDNNTAIAGGQDIYGGNIDDCYTHGTFYEAASHTSHYFSGKVFNAIAHFIAPKRNSISSDPINLKFCNSSSSEKNFSMWPGRTLSVSLRPIGQRNSSTIGSIIIISNDLPSSSSTSHVLSNSHCYDMNVTIYANKTGINKSLEFQLQNYIPIEDTAKAKMYVHILSCPWGFYLNKTSNVCECYEIASGHSCDCNVADGSLRCQYPNWLGCGNKDVCTNSDKVLVVRCSLSYCKSSSSVQSNNINAQCVPGRTGIGCRLCLQPYSAVLGSSKCRICLKSQLWLIVLHSALGVLLIVVLIKFDITVTNGSLNGVIFYANLVYNSYSTLTVSDKSAIYIILSWINLDQGIEACFYKGMTTYHKLWLEFGYIFYLWILQLAIVYLCRKYVFFTRLCGKNVTNAMATIILLTYIKVNRLILAVLNIHKVRSSSGNKRNIWLEVPDKQLGSAEYIILLMVAILLGVLILSFTVCLLTIQVLKKLSDYKLLSWVPRFQPFFEAFTGPCNNDYAFWPGFLFLMRTTSILIAQSDIRTTHNMELHMIYCMLTILVIVFSFVFPSGVYKKWSLNLLELSIMLNLAIYYGSINLINIEKTSHVHHLTIGSASLVMLSFLCYKAKDARKTGIAIFHYTHKKVSYAYHSIQQMYKAKDRFSSSGNSEGVTRSEIQISVPPNETSQLLHVGSARHANSLKHSRNVKSFKDTRETLLESNS